MKLSEELKWRGLIDNSSHEEVFEKLDSGKLKYYVGFDPTAKSIQIGNFLGVVTMMRLQKQGHQPYILVGGATGMIGDPSGKNDERNLLDTETLETNVTSVKVQLSRFLSFEGENKAVLVNNIDWMGKFSFLGFLRDVGKRFRLSEMLAKDSVKSRLSSEAGISYTEFSYQMIQAYDFSFLAKEHDVSLQMGGSDQWGNITAGIDLTRKLHGKSVYGIVTPLVTDANGKKFGKSEGGKTIFLDESMTSPYAMYQYLLNSDDKSVIQYLKFYTFFTRQEIEDFENSVTDEPHKRAAQIALAETVVNMVHGEEGLESAQRATSFFFGGKIENVTDAEVESIFEDVPSVDTSLDDLKSGLPVLDLLALTPLFKSKGEARRSVGQKGVYINNGTVSDEEFIVLPEHLASESALVIRKGKKNYCVVKFS